MLFNIGQSSLNLERGNIQKGQAKRGRIALVNVCTDKRQSAEQTVYVLFTHFPLKSIAASRRHKGSWQKRTQTREFTEKVEKRIFGQSKEENKT